MKNLKNFFTKHYWVFLLIVVLISYGQILGMSVWKDDNAIFFKFDHIKEAAGFFGRGFLGEGPYKFSITPYYPIYKIFGNENLVPYYVLILTFYFVSTLCVYFLSKRLFSSKLARISAFLFATGYIASEGFFWLANSMLANVSLLLITLTLISYSFYVSKKKIFFYLLSIFFYWLTACLVPLRSHFLIAVVLAYEFVFLAFRKFPKTVLTSIFRSIPFLIIFYYYYTSQFSGRTLSVGGYVSSILRGELSNTFSFFSCLTNLLIPDSYLAFVFEKEPFLRNLTGLSLPYIPILSLILLGIFCFLIFRNVRKGIPLTIFSIVLSILWLIFSQEIFNSVLINVSRQTLFTAFLGGMIFYFFLVFYFLIEKEKKKPYLFFLVWVLLSILAYSAYQPTVFFETTHRYLTHSFFGLVGILGLLYLSLREKKTFSSKLGASLIILWGVTNLISSVRYQNLILRERSFPVANFYKQLKFYLPGIKKGDLLYFDVNPNAWNRFRDAFSVSSMPETTAIAWRYGLDRYDFEIYTDFDELASLLAKDRSRIDSLHTFYYDRDGLKDTSQETRDFLAGFSPVISEKDLGKASPLSPILLTLRARVILDNQKLLATYPDDSRPDYSTNLVYIKKLASYLKDRESYYQKVKVKSLSEWKYQEVYNVIDKNRGTSWRGHRIWWRDNQHEQLIIDLGKIEDINRLVWTNWQRLLTPISYTIAVSKDGQNWQTVKSVTSGSAKSDGKVVVEDFEPSNSRFVRFDITRTVSDDSPALGEIEVVKSEYKDIDIGEVDSFLADPLKGISNRNEVREILGIIAPFLKIGVFWKTDKGSFSAQVPVGDGFNNISRYTFILHPGGTRLEDLRFNAFGIPLAIIEESISLKNLNLSNIQEFGLIKSYREN